MKYTILAADDSNLYLSTIESFFAKFTNDVNLITASDGEEACKMALEHNPNLILMDLIMPKMDGIAAIKYLKSKEETKNIPIIILTASESIEGAFKAGADDFIIKPFKHYELQIRIRLALNLVEKIAKIENQNKILQSQNIEIEQQRELLENQKKDIIDDIRYSKRIQNAILPTKTHINSLIKNYFIFNKPRNLVGGDFYWVERKNNKTIIAVADCTGHGISGAFLTMAGMAFIKEIISNYNFNNASEILVHLRNRVIQLLQQKGEEGETADGMDIALCIVDHDKKVLHYSGANNPLYLIRNEELFEYKADRMPIGIHIKKSEPFTNHIIDYKKNDGIYMFSDGLADQFGGPKDKKFRYKQLRELFINIQEKTMPEQQKIVEDTFFNWKGKQEQVDDVLILGIKL